LKLRDPACPYCPGIAFGQKSHLTMHIDVVHLKLRGHACLYCPGVAFGTKSDLTRHSKCGALLKIPRRMQKGNKWYAGKLSDRTVILIDEQIWIMLE